MNEFTCGLCNDVFLNSMPEYLKVAEAERNFGSMPEDKVSLCDECYKLFIVLFNDLKGRGEL